MAHPLVQKYIDRAELAERLALEIAEELDGIAQSLPRKCPAPAGVGCACTGVCFLPEYWAILRVAQRLRIKDSPKS